MRQYWINFNGKQEGPMSLEQMAAMGVDESAYVWHSGLSDWVKITAVPELNDMLQQAREAATNHVAYMPQEQAPELPQEQTQEMPQEQEQEMTQEPVVEIEQDAEVPQEPEVEIEQAPEMPQEQPMEQETPPQMPQEPVAQETPPQMPQVSYPQQLQPQAYASPLNQEEQPECPPSNLVWAIITTLLCCTPAGIVGIVFAYLTKKHYREGNYDKAKKMSDYGAWAIIFSIILGLISMPLSCAVQSLKFMQ
ncbi:MAG: CD225/dispanin family protein [Muribaculaceae bacterium]|nr:CD225/dispanin family protein [Muribaculaceae bacterium]